MKVLKNVPRVVLLSLLFLAIGVAVYGRVTRTYKQESVTCTSGYQIDWITVGGSRGSGRIDIGGGNIRYRPTSHDNFSYYTMQPGETCQLQKREIKPE